MKTVMPWYIVSKINKKVEKQNPESIKRKTKNYMKGNNKTING